MTVGAFLLLEVPMQSQTEDHLAIAALVRECGEEVVREWPEAYWTGDSDPAGTVREWVADEGRPKWAQRTRWSVSVGGGVQRWIPDDLVIAALAARSPNDEDS